MEEKICPYPGLRPFNEEESIFFRGREEHIEKIIAQLEERKFLMLTGASGDGKSSLVYAGVIPNARAGFFKAKFNNWVIVDFRPERNPLQNMAKAIAAKLGKENIEETEKELGFGFSSLINIYKNSPYHLDTGSSHWNKSDEKEKKALKRKAANLFILVDQFEEFFTNSENYNDGQASVNSQTVLNLLLETAKIALAEDIPVYIICTMRSDYIGQCAAFRGLPEYIGFSQFFVPRLKRKEIHQVIAEPAMLSGNSISNRLTETLINELGDGFDQLPVLQHTLNQVWQTAGRGNEEMDLIHLAKLSGLKKETLPGQDAEIFSAWYNSIPDYKKDYFKDPSLESVLNAHANELYETAHDNYNKTRRNKIEKETAQQIIRVVFKCLTKIDDGRAVRNRMSLEEITDVINDPEITQDMVAGVLDVFRKQGNTFIKPFKGGSASVDKLTSTDVLDITHESFIRNWDLLGQWAKEEHENLLNFRDFEKQLNRWVKSGKNSGYLLPIGPFTFFETWYKTCKPNKHWLARYDDSNVTGIEKLPAADKLLDHIKEFLRKSGRKLFFSRTVLRYGARRLLMALGLVTLVTACTFYYFDYREKQNDYVIEEIINEQKAALHNQTVKLSSKANFVILHERLYPGSFTSILDSLHNDTLAFDIAEEMFYAIEDYQQMYDNEANPLLARLIDYFSRQKGLLYNDTSGAPRQEVFSRINKVMYMLSRMHYHDPSPILDRSIEIFSSRLSKLLLNLARNSTAPVNGECFNDAVGLLLNIGQGKDVRGNLSLMYDMCSPFSSEQSKRRFDELFPEKLKLSSYGMTLSHNGGYHSFAKLLASWRGYETLQRCLDTLFMYSDGFTEAKYGKDVFSILCHLAKSGVSDWDSSQFRKTACWITRYREDVSIKDIYGRIFYLLRKDRVRNYYSNNIRIITDEPHLFTTRDRAADFFEEYLRVYNQAIRNKDELNFELAMAYKSFGSMQWYKYGDSKKPNTYFHKAFEYFELVGQSFLDEPHKLKNFNFNPTQYDISYVDAFLTPQSMEMFVDQYTNEAETTCNHRTEPFMNFIMDNQEYLSVYEEQIAGNLFVRFIFDYYALIYSGNERAVNDALYRYHTFIANLSSLLKTERTEEVFLTLMGLNAAAAANPMLQPGSMTTNLPDSIIVLAVTEKSMDDMDWAYWEIFAEYVHNLARIGKDTNALYLIGQIKDKVASMNLYVSAATVVQEEGPVEQIFGYLDTLFIRKDKLGIPGGNLFYLLGAIGSRPMINIATEEIREIPDNQKSRSVQNLVRGVSRNSYYFISRDLIPEYFSTSSWTGINNEILYNELRERDIRKKPEEETLSDHKWFENESIRKSWLKFNDNFSSFGWKDQAINRMGYTLYSE